ncbi:MAG: thioredoxin family protein [Thermoanaerobaculia bacterium]
MKYFKIFLRLTIICSILIGLSFYFYKKIEKKLNPDYEGVKISSIKKPDINSIKREKYEYVKEISCDSAELEEIIKKGNDFILEVGAQSCYPCWLAKNHFEDNAKNLKGIKFYYLDINKCKNYGWIFTKLKIEPFKISGVPQFFHYEKGKVNHFSGYVRREIQLILKAYLK